MPNWVYNVINNYSQDLYDKYKSDDGTRDIDFNKVIPEPEEITNTMSPSNKTAKNIANYIDYRKTLGNDVTNEKLKWCAYLSKEVQDFAEKTTSEMGKLAIADPDRSLNDILSDKENSRQKRDHDSYVKMFGNGEWGKCDNYDRAYTEYIRLANEKFQDEKNIIAKESDSSRSKELSERPDYKFDDLESLGRYLIGLEEKYGYDNWYDWRIANWGVKWNASQTDYIPEDGTLLFNTPWSIPYLVLAKIAEDNPNNQIEGNAEEEINEWLEFYEQDGKDIVITKDGEITYDEEKNEYVENIEELDPPKRINYINLKKEYEKYNKKKFW